MKTSISSRIIPAVGLALLLGGCASLRREPLFICGTGLMLIEEEPAPASPALVTPAAEHPDDRAAGVAAKPDEEEVVVLTNCYWGPAEPRKRAEAAVMY